MKTFHISLPALHLPRRNLSFVLLFNGAYGLWLLFKPVNHALFMAIDDWSVTFGLLTMSLWCLIVLKKQWRLRITHGASHYWAAVLLSMGLLSYTLGQSIWTFYEQVLHQLTPFPSWADVGFLAVYPFVLGGIFRLSTHMSVTSSRTRIMLDALMIMTAIVTFSWYFILGPTIQQGTGTLLAKMVGIAYPCCDLVMVFCLLLLSARAHDCTMRPVVQLLTLSLTILIIGDSLLDFQNLQGTYVTGGLLDITWPLSFLLLGGGALALLKIGHEASPNAIPQERVADISSFGRSLLPYAFIPPVVLLIWYVLFKSNGDDNVKPGVYISVVVLLLLVLFRQIFSLRETSSYAKQTVKLNETLQFAHLELQAKNQALATANARLEALATTDMLTELPNHRALQMLLEQEEERARRSGYPLSLLFFDGDRFKKVNDTYGHATGDVVLQELGERARSVLRAGDTVGRFGGEEFLVLLPQTSQQEARDIAERLRITVAASPLATNMVAGGIAITVSIGMASYPADGATVSEIREQADQAMYWAKRLGRNQVRTAAEAVRANQDAALKAATAHELERHELGSLDSHAPDQHARVEQLGLIYSLMGVLDWREPGMSIHAHEVSNLVAAMARMLQFDEERTLRAATAAFLHDIGKIALPDRLLLQPRQHFLAQEWDLLHQHAELGATIVEASPWLSELAPAIRHHHEHWDGSGVPDGLKDEAIPLEARLISVAEAYHSMISQQPYQAVRSEANAMHELERCAGTQFDPALIPLFRAVLESFQKEDAALWEPEKRDRLTHI